jgi:hypothetical protein
MNRRFIAYLMIISSYQNYAKGVDLRNERIPIKKCCSAPDLRILYNSTSYNSYTANINDKPVCYDNYKSIIYNRYKRNIYMRSKEKYICNDKK